ncbi:hypothetical protein [Cyclobacterium plantarum]|uniref:hypothetical protein n=1 Tax=Cyclobacterium plantarum TaxID=2716263 RepID=UPI003F6E9531
MESILPFIRANSTLTQGVVIVIGYFITFIATNLLIKRIILKGKEKIDVDNDGNVDQKDERIIRDGYIIGKCENIIIITFVLAGEVTGLALIFAAKNLARQKDINDNAGFFLAGTMINFTATLLFAFVIKYVLTLIPAGNMNHKVADPIGSSHFRHYIENFNQMDNELYIQHVPNDSAFLFLAEHIPLIEVPDKDIEETYSFRWWTYRKHIKHTEDGFVITEFLPKAPWSGKTIR